VSIQSGVPRSSRVDFGWIGQSFEIFSRDSPLWILTALVQAALVLPIAYYCNPILFTVVLPGLISGHPGPAPGTNPWAGIETGFLSAPISSLFLAGWFAMANKAVRGEEVGLKDFVSGCRYYGSFLFYNFYYLIATNLGVLACCVGSMMAWGLIWPGFAALADGYDISTAVEDSWNGMKQDLSNATLLSFVVGLLALGGLMCCGVGMLVVGPVTVIIGALAYHNMIDTNYTQV